MKLSEKLQTLRIEKNLKQRELAEKLGVATSVVSDIESGRRPPSKNMAKKLADFFNTSIRYWKDEEEEELYIQNKEEFEFTKKAIKTLKEVHMIANSVPVNEEAWDILKRGLILDLKFMDMKEGKEKK